MSLKDLCARDRPGIIKKQDERLLDISAGFLNSRVQMQHITTYEHFNMSDAPKVGCEPSVRVIELENRSI